MKKSDLFSSELKAARHILLFISIAFVTLMILSLLLGYFLYIRKFMDLENRYLQSQEQSVERIIEEEIGNLMSTCLDWSVWDDSWSFMRGTNPGFIESNLSEETLTTLKLNLMSFVLDEGSVTWQMEVDPETGMIRQDPLFPSDRFPADIISSLVAHSNKGIIPVGGTLFFMVLNPITKGSDKESTQGYLILGKEFTSRENMRLSHITNVNFRLIEKKALSSLLSPPDIERLVLEERVLLRLRNSITSYIPLKTHFSDDRDIFLNVWRDRNLMQLGLKSFFQYLLISLAGVLVTALGVLRYFRKEYMQPVMHLYRSVRRIKEEGDLSFRISYSEDNEFGRLCDGFNSLLDVIEDQTRELSQKNKILLEQANTDELTGLLNKRYLNTWLDERSYKGGREEPDGSILMLDIDHFKLYNDRYGHIAGDLCLRKVAEVLHRIATRNTDYSFRYGGEEFLIILGDTDCHGAGKVAERILEEIAALKIENADAPTSPYITVSIGISCGPLTYSREFAEQLIVTADEALYRSKKEGRNRQTLSNSCPSE